MEEFDFDYHMCTIAYPESGSRLQLGNSWMFTAAPTAPDQRTLTLSFSGMRVFWNRTLNVPDVTKEPKLNIWRLEQFYLRHRMWKRFEYHHAQHGLMLVTFNKPLSTPKKSEGAMGFVEGFEIELLEHP